MTRKDIIRQNKKRKDNSRQNKKRKVKKKKNFIREDKLPGLMCPILDVPNSQNKCVFNIAGKILIQDPQFDGEYPEHAITTVHLY